MIKEVNGQPVKNNPEKVQKILVCSNIDPFRNYCAIRFVTCEQDMSGIFECFQWKTSQARNIYFSSQAIAFFLQKDSSTKVTLKVSPSYTSKPYHGQVRFLEEYRVNVLTLLSERGEFFLCFRVLGVHEDAVFVRSNKRWWHPVQRSGFGFPERRYFRNTRSNRRHMVAGTVIPFPY